MLKNGSNQSRKMFFDKGLIFWEGHKILRNLHGRFNWHFITNFWWRFCKNLWPSQNIFTTFTNSQTSSQKLGIIFRNCVTKIKVKRINDRYQKTSYYQRKSEDSDCFNLRAFNKLFILFELWKSLRIFCKITFRQFLILNNIKENLKVGEYQILKKIELIFEHKSTQYSSLSSKNDPWVTRLWLWRLIFHGWHKLHFYKEIKCCKICYWYLTLEIAQSLQKSEFLKLISVCTPLLISCCLYTFYPIFYCGLYSKAANVKDNLGTKQGNSSKINSGSW